MAGERAGRAGGLLIREAQPSDASAIWGIIGPVIRAGETYTIDRDISRESALAYWMDGGGHCFVAEEAGVVLGTDYLKRNQAGGGSHVANCGYVVGEAARGKGIARAMCEHSMQKARELGFAAMQFNFVVSINIGAVRLWESLGFAIVGRLPDAFDHPKAGHVDALVMHRKL